MIVTPLVPDAVSSLGPVAPAAPTNAVLGFRDALDAANAVFDRADRAESAFVHGRGGMQEMVVERARADVALSIATTAATRTAQAVSTVMGMQI